MAGPTPATGGRGGGGGGGGGGEGSACASAAMTGARQGKRQRERRRRYHVLWRVHGGGDDACQHRGGVRVFLSQHRRKFSGAQTAFVCLQLSLGAAEHGSCDLLV